MHKQLLIVGGSHADIPVIQAAKKLGYTVITTGNNPQDRGHPYADSYYAADYSNPKEILALAKQLHIDAVCASANDFSAISCAYVAQKLHLPGHDSYETALIMHHKDRFRSFALTNGIRVPKAETLALNDNPIEKAKKLSYPLIVKPVDLSGGKGISKVETPHALEHAVASALRATKAHNIVMEEYIEGSNHGYSTFIKNQKVVFGFMDDEHYYLNPYLVSGASTSIHYHQHIIQSLNNDLEKIASKLSLVDGLLHVQFILQDKTPYIIEICRRTPGDLYVKLVEYATGFDMSDAIVRSVTDQPILNYTIKELGFITRHCVMSSQRGKIKNVTYGRFAKRMFSRFSFWDPGDAIEDYLTYKAEIDFIRYNTKEEARRLIPELTKQIKIEFDT